MARVSEKFRLPGPFPLGRAAGALRTQAKFLGSYTNAQRDVLELPAGAVPGDWLFNLDDNAPNFLSTDRITWRDAMGVITGTVFV